MKLRRLIPFLDPSVKDWATEARWLHWLTFFWLSVGLVVLFSATLHMGQEGGGLSYILRQLLWVVLGLAAFYVSVNTPIERSLKITRIAFIALLIMIFATKVPGIGGSVNGASRWIMIGPFPLQPSELMKPFLILQSALIFGNWQRLPLRDRMTWLGIFAVTLVGILAQPNLSTTALCGITLWLVALAAGLPLQGLGLTALGGACLAVLSIFRNEYQMRRMLSFMNPWADSLGDGYQLSQSLLAVGSGGVTGVGYGGSLQKQAFLPFQHTDFIFSIFSEEFGLLGGLFLLLLLFVYSLLALRVIAKTVDPVHRLIGTGAMILLIGQALINMGVAIGVLPTTGLPLPFFSYGGSSMIASLAIAGLLIRVARESQEAEVVPLQAEPALGGPHLRSLSTDNNRDQRDALAAKRQQWANQRKERRRQKLRR
ncbi:MAG: FtsW/RodA/SpoVE family cell cycle protein [Thermosynechococcaceae cyanobacterium]